MIYSVHLFTVGIAVGAILLIAHLFALWRAGECRGWLQKFPRSRVAGTVLLVIATIWSFLLIKTMDLGEFAKLRNVMLLAIVVGAFLSWQYVEEFLAVRALGMIALLAAEPLLEAAFLRPEQTRLLLVVLAYGWIGLGLFWVGMPWVLRDQISWLTKQPARFRFAAIGGAAYGALILISALVAWR